MSNLVRLLVLSIVLLLLFLVAALLAQTWLHHQHQRIQAEAIAVKRLQFLTAAELTAGTMDRWSDAHFDLIGRLIDAKVSLSGTEPGPVRSGRIRFQQQLPSLDVAASESVDVEFNLPAMAQLSMLHGRTWSLLLIVALSLMLLFITSGLWLTRRLGGPDSRSPWSALRSDMSSWMQLAQTSVDRGTALAEERDSRQRIEKDLNLHQVLQTKALEEKIRLGRDLHDGVIQSLYAVGLTIETVRPLIKSDPVKADRRLEECLEGLNRSIREVRQYITGLSPEKLRRMGFADAVQMFAQELGAGRPIELESVIDEDAAAALSAEQSMEALQVTHEAISNALRHGKASAVTVRLHRSDVEIGLLVRDNGRGFNPEKIAQEGHGLANMQARARNAGATLRIDSKPGDGARVVMTFSDKRIP